MHKIELTVGCAVLCLLSGARSMASPGDPTATVLTLSATEVEAHSPVVFTATVTPSSVTGLVTFLDGSRILGVSPLVSGVANLTTNQLRPGSLELRARYQGGGDYLGSVSDPVALEVTLLATGLVYPAFGLPVSPQPFATASGDFDGNSWRDLAILSKGAGEIDLLLVVGPESSVNFVPATPVTGLNQPRALAAGDFNQDGFLDLAVANTGDGNIKVFLGNGDGTFQAGAAYPTTAAPSGILAVDITGDGVVDLVTQDGTGGVDLFRGTGDGTFDSAWNTPISGSISGFAAGEFNGDGIADLAITVSDTNSVAIIRGSRCGLDPVYYAVGRVPVKVAVADFNEDGSDDLAVLNNQDATVGMLFGNGDGTFQAQSVVSHLGGNGSQIVSGDFDGDGQMDLLLSDSSGLTVIVGKGNGLFFDPFYIVDSPLNFSSFEAFDVDHDGRLDVQVILADYDVVGFLKGGPMYLAPVAGSGQTAQVANPFGTRLKAQFMSFGQPGRSDEASVTFQAPLTGPSGFFAGFGRSVTVEQSESGSVEAPAFVANDSAGSFSVSTEAQFSLGDFSLTSLPSSSGSSPCSFTVSPGVLIFNGDGGGNLMTVTPSGSGCTWSATGDRDWLGVYGANIIGAGTISVTASQNLSGSKRAGSVLIAGQYVTVAQWNSTPTLSDMPAGVPFAGTSTSMIGFGFSSGCNSNPLEYCPDSLVTRAQAAVFLVRGVYGNDNFSYSNSPHFADVMPSDFGFAWIQKLYELGITAGCGGGDYCPDQQITRDQAAVMVVRARLGSWTTFSNPSTPYFSDVPTDYWAFRYIQRLRLENITSGCGGGNFCPGRAVTRGEMGAFIIRGLTDEFLPAGMPLVTQVSDPVVSRNQQLTLRITGANTHFDPQNTSIVPMPGLTFSNMIVSSPTNLSVNLGVDGQAALNLPESIIAITGAEEAVIPNAIQVQDVP